MTAIVMSRFSRRGGTIAAKFAIALGVLGHGGAAQATDGYFLSGVGTKAKGEAGVAIALPQDALSIAANPAAATELGDRLDGGIELFIPDRGATIRGNGAGADGNFSGNGANPFVLPEVGYVRQLSEKVAIGIALYGGGGMNTTYARNPFASFGAKGAAGVDLKQMLVAPTLAVKALPGQSIGVPPLLAVQIFSATGLQPFAAQSLDPARFTDKGANWAVATGVRLGWLGHFGSRVTLGAFYQSKLRSRRFDDYAGLFPGHGRFDVPASYGAGLSIRPIRALTLSGDVKRIDYAGVAAVGNPLSRLFAGNLFGSDDGPGFGWRDITVYKAGIGYTIDSHWTVRAGYGRSGNPVPASQTLLNILAPGVVQSHYTAGATWTSRSGVEVTGYVMRAPRNRVAGSGSIPIPFGGGEADIDLAETSLGLSFGKRF